MNINQIINKREFNSCDQQLKMSQWSYHMLSYRCRPITPTRVYSLQQTIDEPCKGAGLKCGGGARHDQWKCVCLCVSAKFGHVTGICFEVMHLFVKGYSCCHAPFCPMGMNAIKTHTRTHTHTHTILLGIVVDVKPHLQITFCSLPLSLSKALCVSVCVSVCLSVCLSVLTCLG